METVHSHEDKKFTGTAVVTAVGDTYIVCNVQFGYILDGTRVVLHRKDRYDDKCSCSGTLTRITNDLGEPMCRANCGSSCRLAVHHPFFFVVGDVLDAYQLVDSAKSDAPCACHVEQETAAVATEKETFESGAVRDVTDYRYDLMSHIAVDYLLRGNAIPRALALDLFDFVEGKVKTSALLIHLKAMLECTETELAHLYAQALHEGSSKYGEKNWEKGIPISNLLNHSLHHLFKSAAGDTSENHRSHLVWNVLTLIHFINPRE